MINKYCSVSFLMAAAGLSIASEPIVLEPDSDNVRHAGHIYYNIATGEKITTLIDVGDLQQQVSSVSSPEVWVANTRAQCAEFGDDIEYFFDLNEDTGCSASSCIENYVLLDWSELPTDTVVDCVQVHWITDHNDTDTNSDGIADGVEGFSGNWVFWDAVASHFAITAGCISSPLIGFQFDRLQGQYPPSEEGVARWTADIDLGSEFGSSLVFEIGDTDSDLQGAAVHNARIDLRDFNANSNPDFDENNNGLADWGWSVFFTVPGTVDTDNADGDNNWQTGIDGVNLGDSIHALNFATSTPGHAEYDSIEDRWDWVGDGTTAWPGEDLMILGVPATPDGNNWTPFGPFFFGGFDCSPDDLNRYIPYTQFEMVLYTPGIQYDCGDINGDGVLDFFDVSLFLNQEIDYNQDTVFDFFDISMFLNDFTAGCP